MGHTFGLTQKSTAKEKRAVDDPTLSIAMAHASWLRDPRAFSAKRMREPKLPLSVR
jgi:hypothetical protein